MRDKKWIPTMKIKKENVETELTNEVTEETITEDEKQEEQKMGFLKKHGKKIAIGLGIALAGAGGFILGSKSSDEEDVIDTGFEPVDPEDQIPFDTDDNSKEE